MKEWLKSYFYVPKHGKVRERTMLGRLTLTVAVIVGCLIAMSVSAYAYFSCSMFSGSNVIRSARFETAVSMNVGSAEGEEVLPVARTQQTYRAKLKQGIDYYVTVALDENNTASTGYFVLSAQGCDITYHTQQVFASGQGTDRFSFILTVSEDTEVELLSAWGTSALFDTPDHPRYVTAGETVHLTVRNNLSQSPIKDSAPAAPDGNTDLNSDGQNITDSQEPADSTEPTDTQAPADSTESTDVQAPTDSTETTDTADGPDSDSQDSIPSDSADPSTPASPSTDEIDGE